MACALYFAVSGSPQWIEVVVQAFSELSPSFLSFVPVVLRAAAVMSLIQNVRLNGHDPYAYLKDVPARLPTHSNRLIAELLPHLRQPAKV